MTASYQVLSVTIAINGGLIITLLIAFIVNNLEVIFAKIQLKTRNPINSEKINTNSSANQTRKKRMS